MYLSVVPYLALLIACATSAAVNNKCHMDNLSDCGSPLSDFRKEIGQKFPTTEDQVSDLCEDLDKAKTCFTEFKDSCMTPMQLEIIGFVSEGAHEVYREFCKAGSEIRTNYLEHAECINTAYESDEYKELSTYIEAALEDLRDKPYSEQLPTACCAYHWIESKSKKLGAEKCGQDAVDAFQKVVTMAASSVPEILCNGFEPESQQCTSLLPPAGTKPKGSIRNSHVAQTFSELYL